MKKMIAALILTSLLLVGCSYSFDDSTSLSTSEMSSVASASSDTSSEIQSEQSSDEIVSSEAITATAPSKPQLVPKQVQESEAQIPSVEKVKIQIVDKNSLPVICARAALSKESLDSYMEQEHFTAYETDSNGFVQVSYSGDYGFNIDNGSYFLYVEQQNSTGWMLDRVEIEISDNTQNTVATMETSRTWEDNQNADGRVEVDVVDSNGNAVADVTVVVSFTGIGPAISGPYSEFGFKTNSDGKAIFLEKGEGKHKAVAYKGVKQLTTVNFTRETKDDTTTITLTV